ncbi:hypothetical protein OEIGOIKO_05837 [Streptomyces chrestomyceticus JCM 4735]|uniref:Uncharacterized protein n=1 Tax=Streptomyces chrestomyceticus JCM 4735 TaxID=1306181 RepID=A0A7U9L076_9ACTN|nr:hypothetical protein [Streptomyces chrestomyceticus]GCD38027.1 hypothetical protein OEIGOIKO_05837 [Streptomyces chrestomyceticus JCM 4735]
MSYTATFFLEPQATARCGVAPLSVLYIEPDGSMQNDITLQFPSAATLDEQVATADRILAAVQEWRDSIVAYRDQKRTAADELAEAREEIARLKAEVEGGA